METVEIAATSAEDVKNAEEKIRAITAMPEIGKEYTGKVVRTASFGAFVEILPGKDGLVHISQMGDGYVRRCRRCYASPAIKSLSESSRLTSKIASI